MFEHMWILERAHAWRKVGERVIYAHMRECGEGENEQMRIVFKAKKG